MFSSMKCCWWYLLLVGVKIKSCCTCEIYKRWMFFCSLGMRTQMQIVGLGVNKWSIHTGRRRMLPARRCMDTSWPRSSHVPRDLFSGSEAVDVHELEGIIGVSCLEWAEGFQGSTGLSLFLRWSAFDQISGLLCSLRKFFPNSVLGGRWTCRSLMTRLLLSAFHWNREGIVNTLRGFCYYRKKLLSLVFWGQLSPIIVNRLPILKFYP